MNFHFFSLGNDIRNIPTGGVDVFEAEHTSATVSVIGSCGDKLVDQSDLEMLVDPETNGEKRTEETIRKRVNEARR